MNTPTPAPLWTLSYQSDSEVLIKSPPLIYRDRIYFIVDSILHCLNLVTGETLWTTTFTATHPKGIINQLQLQLDGHFYLASYSGWLAKVDAETGWIKWQKWNNSWNHATPQIEGDRLYLNTEKNSGPEASAIECYSIVNGELLWRSAEISSYGPCSVTIGPDRLFAGTENKLLNVFNKATGEFIDSYFLGGQLKSRAVWWGGDLLAVTHSGKVELLSPQLESKATTRLGATCWHVIPQLLFSREQEVAIIPTVSSVVALNKQLEEVWSSELFGTFNWWATPFRQSVVVAGSDGKVTQLALATGNQLTEFQANQTLVAPPAINESFIALLSTESLSIYSTNVLT